MPFSRTVVRRMVSGDSRWYGEPEGADRGAWTDLTTELGAGLYEFGGIGHETTLDTLSEHAPSETENVRFDGPRRRPSDQRVQRVFLLARHGQKMTRPI